MSTLRNISAERIREILSEGALCIDLRPTEEYLAHHVPGSIPLLYEPGPGLGGRARDLLPLDSRLVLLGDGASPLERAADSFRGKGFDVIGYRGGGVDAWPGTPVTTPTVAAASADDVLALIDVADPGMALPPGKEPAARIPAERLWTRSAELGQGSKLGILAGWGVRAAAAIGILEKLGFPDLTFVRTRPAGAKPPMAGSLVFRAGGPA